MGSAHCYPWDFEFQYYQNHMGSEVILDRMPPYLYYIKPACQLIMLIANTESEIVDNATSNFA